MYGKFYESTFTGSMIGAGSDVFAVWGYIVSHAKPDSCVELNSVILSTLIGSPVESIEKAIEYLSAPDPKSRTPDAEGRRITKVAPFLFHVTNHTAYRIMRDEEDRREYMREYMREYRKKDSEPVKRLRKPCKPTQTHTQKQSTEAEKKGNASLALISEIFEKWNATKTLPGCLIISDKRRQTLKVRFKEPFFCGNWQTALQKVLQSAFCLGENDRGWKANFDWFISPDAVMKIMEGKYDSTIRAEPKSKFMENLDKDIARTKREFNL